MKIILLREEDREVLSILVSKKSSENRKERYSLVPDSPEMHENLRWNRILGKLSWKLSKGS